MFYVQLPLGFKWLMFKTFFEKGKRNVTDTELELCDEIVCCFNYLDSGEPFFPSVLSAKFKQSSCTVWPLKM
jgi:hypothetical protein